MLALRMARAPTERFTITLTRNYTTQADLPNHVPLGGPTSIGIDSAYSVAYGYDSVGRLNNVTGPGLPAGITPAGAGLGAVYTFAADSDMVSRIDFNTNGPGAPGLATTTRSFEPTRDLITQIENKWGATTVSKYTHANRALGRRLSVVMLGTAQIATADSARRLNRFGVPTNCIRRSPPAVRRPTGW